MPDPGDDPGERDGARDASADDRRPDPAEPDFVLEDGLMVATRSGLLRRGTCCGLACRNCPYVGTTDEHPGRWRRAT